MISTVTTTTVTILNSAAAASLTLIVILALITLLIQKEIITGLSADWARRMCQAINVALMPLIVVFLVTFAIRVADALQ
ncbi:MAG TPA: hypothetical protein VKE41_04790 [Roseiflexaceae bacterium]|nr:hypothetical protein [Roseiflexaceae bacterium]